MENKMLSDIQVYNRKLENLLRNTPYFESVYQAMSVAMNDLFDEIGNKMSDYYGK